MTTGYEKRDDEQSKVLPWEYIVYLLPPLGVKLQVVVSVSHVRS